MLVRRHGNRGVLIAEIGLDHERIRDTGKRRLVSKVEQGVLVWNGDENQVVRAGVPLRGDLGVLDGELESSVCCLRCLQAGRKIRPSRNVELVGRGDEVALGVGHVDEATTPWPTCQEVEQDYQRTSKLMNLGC